MVVDLARAHYEGNVGGHASIVQLDGALGFPNALYM